MSWYALRVRPAARREAVIAALFASGAEGVQDEGETVVTHFPSDDGARAAAGAVTRVDEGASCDIAAVPDVDWSTAWRRQLGAYSLGNLTIVPPWLADGRDPRRTIVIEPGMAFGTGDHPSTRGAGRLLEATVRPGDVVADLGTGSAVLAIAAARLGATAVHAIEIDDEALDNARENISANDAGEVVNLLEGDAAALLPIVAPVDVIVANILSSVLVPMLSAMRAALRAGGRAILAGMLIDEREVVCREIEAGGWRLDGEDIEEGWWSARIAPA